MRYWVYHDSRLLGPLSKEDLPGVSGLHSDSLVCEEGSTGVMDKDWRPLSSIPELSESGLAAAAAAHGSSLLEAEGGFDSFQRQAHESIERIGYSGPWVSGIFDDSRVLDPLGDMPGLLHPEEQLEADRSHILEMEDRLSQLKAQLEKYETRQDEILDKLSEKDHLLAEREKEVEALRRRLVDMESRGPAAMAEPELEEPPARPAPKAQPPRPKAPARAPAPKRPPAPPPPPPVEEPAVEEPVAEEPPAVLNVQPPVAERPAPRAPMRPVPKLEIVPFADMMDEPPARPRQDADASRLRGSPGVADDVAGSAAEFSGAVAPPLEASSPAEGSAPDVAPVPEFMVAAGEPAIPDIAPPMAEEAQAPAVAEFAVSQDAPPALEEAPPPAFEAAPPAFEAAAPAPAEGGIESLELRSTSDMPQGIDFVPPTPDEAAPRPAPAVMEMPSPAVLEAPPAGSDPQIPDFMQVAPAPSMEEGVEQPHTMVFGQESAPAEQGNPDMIPLTAPPRDISFPPEAQPPDPGNLALTPPPMAGQGGAWPGPEPSQFPGQIPTPMPIPLGGMTPFPASSPTPMPTMGQPDLPETVMAGLGVASTSTPSPGQTWPGPDIGGQSFEDLMGKPPTVSGGATSPRITQVPALTSPPTAGGTESGKEPKKGFRPSKKFLIGMGAAGLALILILMFFLRNPKQVSKMVEMAPEEKTQGDINVPPGGAEQPPGSAQGQGQEPGNGFFAQRPGGGQQTAPEGAPEVEAQPTPVPAQPATPPKGRDFIPDQRIEAMEFVKNYSLDTERGTIEQWLEYAFLSPGHTPEWTAGAVDADTWLVEYNVFEGARGKKPRMTYRFEVSLARKTLSGRNPAAKDLLSGGAAAPQERKRAVKKPAARPPSKSRKAASRTISHGRPSGGDQEPLPDEADLDSSSIQPPPQFNNPAGD